MFVVVRFHRVRAHNDRADQKQQGKRENRVPR
jgi:hypothetical protein